VKPHRAHDFPMFFPLTLRNDNIFSDMLNLDLQISRILILYWSFD